MIVRNNSRGRQQYAIPTEWIFTAGTGLALVDGCAMLSPLGFLGMATSLLGGITFAVSSGLAVNNPLSAGIYRFWQKYGQRSFLFFAMLFTFGVLVFGTAVEPASAIFLQGTIDFATSAITKVMSGAGDATKGADVSKATDMITFVFNTARILFAIYFIGSIAYVIKAANDKDDWQSLARAPGIMLIALVMCDMVCNFITGGVALK
jgi:hypothetical protein